MYWILLLFFSFVADVHFVHCLLLVVHAVYTFMYHSRGVTSNTTAVAIPIAITIFMTDVLKHLSDGIPL